MSAIFVSCAVFVWRCCPALGKSPPWESSILARVRRTAAQVCGVWVVDPDRRLARVYRADGTETLLDADGVLDGDHVLPDFRCALADVLD